MADMRKRAGEALAFPLDDRAWVAKMLIGGAVGLALQALFVGLGFLFTREFALEVSPLAQAANFPALGFVLQVFQGAMATPQAETMPDWKRWPGLCLKGLLLFALALVYGILPLLLIISGFNLLVRGGVELVLGLVMTLLGTLAGLTLGFFLPMGVARYLEERRVEAAFHPGVVWWRIRRVLAEYAAAYLLSIASLIVAGFIGAVPYLGVLVWPFLTFYFMVAAARLFGGVCSGAG
jgi:hypothetical protein